MRNLEKEEENVRGRERRNEEEARKKGEKGDRWLSILVYVDENTTLHTWQLCSGLGGFDWFHAKGKGS